MPPTYEPLPYVPLPPLNQKLIFPKVVQQHYVGEVGKSVTFVLHIFSIYSMPNIVAIGQHV